MILLAACASFGAAFLLSSALNWLALIPWRRSVGAHWTERARRLYPTRMSMLINSWLLGVFAAIIFHTFHGGAVVQSLPSGLSAWLGASLSGYFRDRDVWRDLTFRDWARQFALYAVLLQAPVLFLAIAVAVMPTGFGWRAWLTAGCMVLLLLSWPLFGFTLKVLRWTGLVQPAPAHVRDLAARAAERVGARLRNAWITHGPIAQAFALLPMKDMLFSEPLLQVLTEEELESVCAHEAGHLTESKWVFGGRMTGIAALSPLTLVVPVFNRFGPLGLLPLLLATLAVMMLPLWVARRMEKRADVIATKHTEDPAAYARALEKVYQLNAMPAAMPKRSGQAHPDLYDRMIAAGVTPAYERPRRPAKVSWTTFVLVVAFATQLALVTTVQELEKVARHEPSAAPGWTFSQPQNSTGSTGTNAP